MISRQTVSAVIAHIWNFITEFQILSILRIFNIIIEAIV